MWDKIEGKDSKKWQTKEMRNLTENLPFIVSQVLSNNPHFLLTRFVALLVKVHMLLFDLHFSAISCSAVTITTTICYCATLVSPVCETIVTHTHETKDHKTPHTLLGDLRCDLFITAKPSRGECVCVWFVFLCVRGACVVAMFRRR